jgi:hypothetical protein
MVLCLAEQGPATVTSVRPVDPSGALQVVDFALRPNPVYPSVTGRLVGSHYGTLESAGIAANKLADQVCSEPPGEGSELVLELSKTAGANASGAGWVIEYSTPSGRGEITFPMGVVLCTDPLGAATCPGG